ncbi:MAG: ABC transporter ATP-binding protein [Alphaproteobacteria bacterium]|nr:ABC transporter ATP-binding protein [Alphaproteobacteria bacterium]
MSAPVPKSPVLEVRGLKTHFFTRGGVVKAVDGVDFSVARGRVLGLVGESGSGKTVTGLSLIGLIDPPGRVVEGSVRLGGQELIGLAPDALRRVRGRRIAMIFQDPMMTLNPVLKVGTQLSMALRAHEAVSADAVRRRSTAALGRVGLPSPEACLDAYPHQLSGGMRQRVAIAIAMLHRPDVIVADEPTTALDVSIQGQILHEMQSLAAETGVALVWITHDLAVVSSLAHDIAVMYAGRIVEYGAADEVLSAPRHPYTRGLLESVPGEAAPGSELLQIPGSIPALVDLPPGCAFRARCRRADGSCETMPEIVADGAGRTLRCHHPLEAA